ncbi:cytochrome c biogenesis protein ResB [Corynebacterium sp. MSK006]|uniref:cytochrome c biogenesis protein ResB n=1 Tax=Corynebacterium sp. MSK006 TaxID=3050187 RepID=UPI0025514B16|nr:cytochrome c biogenesis protein ResB [Corynebacterium sp. MSK006]MDK8895874.1 cytochrome c biogenesis protein ResB [Corynebacterium sp. MSK006]
MKQVTRWLRRAWNWLTSMRTALILLFLVAVAAIPGALLPQRSLNEEKVNDYIANNGRLAEIYDKLQLFDVFSSSWFTAIYVLLTISLVGCIIPRSWEHYKAMRAKPVRAPKRLTRMPHHHTGHLDATPDEVLDQVRGRLKGWRVSVFSAEEDRAGVRSLSAERGYAREFFNLVFHLGLVAILVTIAAGRMVYYEGQVIVVTESGSTGAVALDQSTEFCNTSDSNFDSFRSGPLYRGKLSPFCFIAHDFTADYLPNGQAEMFTSNISYAEGEDITTNPATWRDYELKVNHPLRLGGDRVYLQGHGFAPTFTVKWPNGETRTQTIQFRPDDPTNFLSSGAMRFDPPAGMYPDLYERRQNQLAIEGLFAPTAEWTGENGALLSSSFPELRDPAVAIDVYRGDNGLDTGVGQSIFSLDASLVHSGQLQRIERVNLNQGESVTLDDGTELTFDGASEYANYQIARDPFQGWVLVSAVIMLGSLVASLAIKRRRVWVRVRPAAAGGTDLEMAGLARTDRAGWGEEFEELYRDIFDLPDPDEVEGGASEPDEDELIEGPLA